MPKWMPIETAPKDGSWFVTYSPGSDDYFYPGFDFAKWSVEGKEWCKVGCGWDFATHWMPLPSPPE